VADLPTPPPSALHPGKREPVGAEDFAPLVPMPLIEQEVSTERYIDIPGGVLDVCKLWRVAASCKQKSHRKQMMEIRGPTLHPSPSELTEFGRSLLAKNPDHLGSVLSHVLVQQTIIGEEALLQLAKAEEVPDVLVGCTGGGSNFGGLAFPFLREKLAGKMNPIIRCVVPAACPTLTKGEYRYDLGDSAGMTPLPKTHTLGHSSMPELIYARSLRYHDMANYELPDEAMKSVPVLG
jgi:tryptophan synthase beta chain